MASCKIIIARCGDSLEGFLTAGSGISWFNKRFCQSTVDCFQHIPASVTVPPQLEDTLRWPYTALSSPVWIQHRRLDWDLGAPASPEESVTLGQGWPGSTRASLAQRMDVSAAAKRLAKYDGKQLIWKKKSSFLAAENQQGKWSMAVPSKKKKTGMTSELRSNFVVPCSGTDRTTQWQQLQFKGRGGNFPKQITDPSSSLFFLIHLN